MSTVNILIVLPLLADLAAGVYLSEAPSPPRFYLGWQSNFVGLYTVYYTCRRSPHSLIPSPPPSPCYKLYK
jgi:hypothetical protein